MGKKSFQFLNAEHEPIEVVFSGDNVVDGELVPAGESPVVLTMEASGEYKAVKYTTASIEVITDGLSLLDLYATEPLSVRVEISNLVTGVILFRGFFSPNVYNQSISGVCDSLTIECVDCIGISKFMQYKLSIPSYYIPQHMSILTLRELMLHISSLLPFDNVFFADFLKIVSGTGLTTDKYEQLTISESYFIETLQSGEQTASDKNYMTVANNAITVYEVLEMIASSLRATFVQDGGDLYLIDELMIAEGVSGAVSFKPLNEGYGTKILRGNVVELTEDDVEGEFEVSVVSRNSLYKLANTPESEIQITPDIFSRDEVAPIFDTYERSGYFLYEQLESRLLMEGEMWGYIELSDDEHYFYVAYDDPDKNWNNVVTAEYAAGGVVLEVNRAFIAPVLERESLGLKLSISAAFTQSSAFAKYPKELFSGGQPALSILLSVTTPSGEVLYWDCDNNAWTNAVSLITIRFVEGSEWRNDFRLLSSTSFQPIVAAAGNPTLIIAPRPPAGSVALKIVCPKNFTNSTSWTACYIRDIALHITPVPRARIGAFSHMPPAVESEGVYSFDKVGDPVELPIQLRLILAEKIFGTTIDGVDYFDRVQVSTPPDEAKEPLLYYRWLCDYSFQRADGTTYTMMNRITEQGRGGEGIELSLQLKDKHNASYTMCDSLLSTIWRLPKRITGFERDLQQSTIYITVR